MLGECLIVREILLAHLAFVRRSATLVLKQRKFIAELLLTDLALHLMSSIEITVQFPCDCTFSSKSTYTHRLERWVHDCRVSAAATIARARQVGVSEATFASKYHSLQNSTPRRLRLPGSVF